MRSMVLGTTFLLTWGSTLAAADAKAAKKDLTPAEEVKKLIDDYDLDRQEFSKLLREASTDQQRQKIVNEKAPKPGKVADRLLELAEKNPKDKGVAPAALIWIVRYGGSGAAEFKRRDQALDLLANYAHNPSVADVCSLLTRTPSLSGEKFLRAVMEKGPTNEAKGKAVFNLGKYLGYTAETIRALKDKPDMLDGLYTRDVIKHLRDGDPDAMTKEAEKLLSTAAKRYTDVRIGSHLLSEMAETELFELRDLAIGKTAPQIEGVDLDGKKMKLSEYRGKVTVIDFWGNWSASSRDMYPQERALVKRLADKPFVLLGVNSDTKAAELRRAMEKEQITWRSWWNGPEGANGPLSKKWNVHSWPTIYVLDHKGVIRYKNVLGDKLDEAVDKLLRELAQEGK